MVPPRGLAAEPRGGILWRRDPVAGAVAGVQLQFEGGEAGLWLTRNNVQAGCRGAATVCPPHPLTHWTRCSIAQECASSRHESPRLDSKRPRRGSSSSPNAVGGQLALASAASRSSIYIQHPPLASTSALCHSHFDVRSCGFTSPPSCPPREC